MAWHVRGNSVLNDEELEARNNMLGEIVISAIVTFGLGAGGKYLAGPALMWIAGGLGFLGCLLGFRAFRWFFIQLISMLLTLALLAAAIKGIGWLLENSK